MRLERNTAKGTKKELSAHPMSPQGSDPLEHLSPALHLCHRQNRSDTRVFIICKRQERDATADHSSTISNASASSSVSISSGSASLTSEHCSRCRAITLRISTANCNSDSSSVVLNLSSSQSERALSSWAIAFRISFVAIDSVYSLNPSEGECIEGNGQRITKAP